MNNNKIIIIAFLFAGLLCCGSGCSRVVADKPSCISNERARATVIRWGNYDVQGGRLQAYQINGSLGIAKANRESFKEQVKVDDIKTIDGFVFCKWLEKTIDLFAQIQTLNSPGETARYIEYSNGKTTVRAVWNPKYKTFGSQDFRNLYDSLMTLIPENNRWSE